MKLLILLFTVPFFALTACVAVDDGIPNFERMSDEELAAYNQGKPLLQMIVCVEDDRSFSRVRRKTCATVERMYGSAAQVDQINVLGSGSSISSE